MDHKEAGNDDAGLSTGEATVLSRRQAQPRVGRGRGQPGPDKAVDLLAASVRMLAAHPLLVQLHAKVVHVQRGAQALGFRGLVEPSRPSGRPSPGQPREQQPESASPVHISMILARLLPA
jgi:hypothetical protein